MPRKTSSSKRRGKQLTADDLFELIEQLPESEWWTFWNELFDRVPEKGQRLFLDEIADKWMRRMELFVGLMMSEYQRKKGPDNHTITRLIRNWRADGKKDLWIQNELHQQGHKMRNGKPFSLRAIRGRARSGNTSH